VLLSVLLVALGKEVRQLVLVDVPGRAFVQGGQGAESDPELARHADVLVGLLVVERPRAQKELVGKVWVGYRVVSAF
jgi:hypothetical protein